MTSVSATFEVQDLFTLPDRFDTFVAGKVISGVVQEGMLVSILIDGGAFWTLTIKSVESVRTVDGRADVALALDTSNEEAQIWFKGLCAKGDILVLQPANMANQSTDPTLASGTSGA